MDETNHLDFTKLLGFNTVADELSGGLDLQDETFGDKLGAKVGDGTEAHSSRLNASTFRTLPWDRGSARR